MAIRLFEYADEDRSGTINFREFSAAFLQVEEEPQKKKVRVRDWKLVYVFTSYLSNCNISEIRYYHGM